MPMNGSWKMIARWTSGTLSASPRGERNIRQKRQGKAMKSKTEALLEKLHERIAAAPAKPQQLQASPAQRSMDSVTRESHIRMISSLRRFYRPYGMDLIVNQALIGKSSLDGLEDDELASLLRTIDRARE